MGRPGPSPSDRKGAGVLWEVGAVSLLQLLAGCSLPATTGSCAVSKTASSRRERSSSPEFGRHLGSRLRMCHKFVEQNRCLEGWAERSAKRVAYTAL
jgi:hypothetical protein